MDWIVDWLSPLLRCDDNTGPRLLVILVGAVASTVTITVGGHSLYRRVFGPSGAVRRAAQALRDEGEVRAYRGEWIRAVELYSLSILTNPRPGHVYYLRGLAKEKNGNVNRAIADWQRCVDRLPNHGDALAKLAQYKRRPQRRTNWRLVFGAAALAAMGAIIGFWVAHIA